MKFEFEFLELAKKSGYHAQVNCSESTSINVSYKTLTGESVTQKATERKYGVSLEKNGKKSHRSLVDDGKIHCSKVFEEMKILCEIATADIAEAIPEISDSIEGSAIYFSIPELESWAQKMYSTLKVELQEVVKNSGIPSRQLAFDELGIEHISVGGSITHKTLLSTYGANKISHNSVSSATIGIHGKIGEESNAEWFGESSQTLVKFENLWIEQCTKKLYDVLTHSEDTPYSGIKRVAFEKGLAAELFGEFFGYLGGYAISERMSPFTAEDINSLVLPAWANISSLTSIDEHGISRWYDGNGITSILQLFVIQEGRLKNLFLNVASAQRLGMQAVGHPSPLNILLQGNNPEFLDELVPSEDGNFGTGSPLFKKNKEVKFFCTGLAGMHTMESTTGNFALEGEGYEILEDGTIGNFIKRVGVSGNIRTLFKELVGHGNDFPKSGTFRLPTIVCDGIQLSK